jgi:hypothetical protein
MIGLQAAYRALKIWMSVKVMGLQWFRALVERFTGAGTFDLVGAEDTPAAIDPWLVEGRAQIALVIASGYGAAVAGGHTPRVQVIADGTDANSSGLG